MISENATRGGTLVASLRSEPRTFNRVLDQNFPVDLFDILTSSKLIRVNRATRALEPALVEKWSTSPDNLTYTLTLRDGVAWSDGSPFTSADVLFTFQAIYDPKVASVLASGLRVNGQPLKVTAPDARTVVVTLPGTFGPGIAILDNVAVASEAQAGGRARERHVRTEPRCRHAAGRSGQHRSLHAEKLRGRTAHGVRSQPALLEERRRRHSSSRMPTR